MPVLIKASRFRPASTASQLSRPSFVPFLAGLLLLSFITSLTACKNYGTKTSKEYLEIFYSDGVTDAQADTTLNYLYPLWRNNGDQTSKKSVQLTRTGDTINFRMVTLPDQVDGITEETIGSFIKLLSDTLYNQAPVNLVLCNAAFEPVKTIRYSSKFTNQPVTDDGLGTRFESGNVEVFARNGLTPALAQKFAKFMDDIDEVDEPIKSYTAAPNGDGYLVQMSMKEADVSTMKPNTFIMTASLISDEVFGSKPVTLQLCNTQFRPFKQVSSLDYKPSMDEEYLSGQK